jgi:hypothetical protein
MSSALSHQKDAYLIAAVLYFVLVVPRLQGPLLLI